MNRLYLNIQRFSDGKVVIDTELNTKDFEKGLDKMKSTSQKAGSTIKNIVVGLGITKLIGTAMNQITSSIGDAVTRFDTLNNFPKVMSNLGIGAEESSKSIDKMSEKLQGLPTTLDQGAAAVQRFTSKNGDVEKSTDLFLALNNAILAGGAPTEIQAGALEQLSQAYAKGKPDMMEWRTAMSAMPAQLKQVAESMGYVDADALGEALRNGEVSMDDFMGAITKLNEEGLPGMQSFEEQARNSTGGIGTAITVAKTQVVKGVTDIIDALNVKFEELGIGKVSDIIANIGKKSKVALDVIAKLIKGELSVKEVTDMALGMVNGFLDTINTNLPKMMQKGGEIIQAILTSLIENLPQLIQTGMQIIANIVIGIAQMLPTLIPQIIQVVMTIVDSFIQNLPLFLNAGLQLLMGLVQGLMNALPTLIAYIPTIINSIVNFVISSLPQIIKAGVQIIISLVHGLIQALPQLVAMLPEIIISITTTLIENLPAIIDAGIEILIALIDGIIDAIPMLIDMLPTIIEKIVTTIIKNLPKIIEAGKKILTSLVEGIVKLLSKLNEAGQKIIITIVNKLKELPGRMLEIGKNLVKGIWNGIKDATSWILDKIKGFGKSVLKGIKNIFGIHSPSTVMRDQVGKFLAQGIGVGFDDEIDSVFKDMQNALNTETNKIGSSVQISGASQSVQQMLTASASFDGIIPLQVDLDGEVIYDNQQKISARKNLQYGGVR